MLITTTQPRPGLVRHPCDPLHVLVPCRRMLAGFVELAPAVVAERLQKLIAGFAVAVDDRHERLVDKVSEYVEYVAGGDVVARANQLCGANSEAAGKHRQPPEDALFVAEQQVVTPIDQVAQGLLAWLCRPCAGGQQTEPVVDAGGDVAERQRSRAC